MRMTSIRGSKPPGSTFTLAVILAAGCSSNADFGRNESGGGGTGLAPATGAAGAQPANAGTGGQGIVASGGGAGVTASGGTGVLGGGAGVPSTGGNTAVGGSAGVTASGGSANLGGGAGVSSTGGNTAVGGQGGTAGGAAPCTTSLSTIHATVGFFCPNDFHEAAQWPGDCSKGPLGAYLGSCNGYLAFRVLNNWGMDCFYDPATLSLVGAVALQDVPSFCNRTSSTISAGSYPPACPFTPLAHFSGCVGGSGPGAGGSGGFAAGGGQGGTAGGQGGNAGSGGRCTGTLETVASAYLPFVCPSDYAAATQWRTTCSTGQHGSLGSCNGALALSVSGGAWAKDCFYDPVARTLMGAVAYDDVPSYCNQTSHSIAGGSYPTECPTTQLADLGVCNTCSPTSPCPAGRCEGTSCGQAWSCVVDGRGCTKDLIDYCGCDNVTFSDSSTCPNRPYAYRGACGQGINCDPRDVSCATQPPSCGQGQVPRVVASCYDGACVPIDQCLCTVAAECPDPGQYTCLLSEGHCSYYLP
jgi:hypothetical protein